MKHNWFYLFSLCCILIVFSMPTQAQEVEEEKHGFISGVDVTIDALKPLSYLVDFEDKYEGGLGIFFYDKIMLSGEYGFASLTPYNAIENGYYKSEGDYFRAGLDYHVSLNPEDDLYFGLRYGAATFYDEYQYNIPSTIWDEYESPVYTRNDQQAAWLEVVMGSERSYGKFFLVGFKARVRILTQFDQPGGIETFTIPGYGYADRPVMPAINLYVKFRLPF